MTGERRSSVGQLVRGKVRRFRLAHTRRGRAYIRRMEERRRGECRRCGACCRLVHRCLFLRMADGVASCTIHKYRPANCRIFPVDERDLADRDLIAPSLSCGFFFE